MSSSSIVTRVLLVIKDILAIGLLCDLTAGARNNTVSKLDLDM